MNFSDMFGYHTPNLLEDSTGLLGSYDNGWRQTPAPAGARTPNFWESATGMNAENWGWGTRPVPVLSPKYTGTKTPLHMAGGNFPPALGGNATRLLSPRVSQDKRHLWEATDAVTGDSPSFWEQFTGSRRVGPGWGRLAVPGAIGALQFGLGLKQLGLMKDQLATSKSQFRDQFELQKREINRDMENHARDRYNFDPAHNPTVEDYMKRHGL